MTGQTIILNSSHARDTARRLIDLAGHGYIANVREPARSNEQNDKMWAMLSDIARAKPQGRSLPPDRWKCLFMDDVGHKPIWEPSLDGQGVVNVGYRSSRLTKSQMSDVIEAMYAFGAEHGVRWTEPVQTERRDAA